MIGGGSFVREGGLRPPTSDKDRWYVDPPRDCGRVGMYCDSEAAAKEVATSYPPGTRVVDLKSEPDSPPARALKEYHTRMANPPNPPNPKQRYGDTKVNLALVPSAGVIYAALGFHDGGIKYGPFNWRADAVEIMTYIAACRRHLDAFVDGEDLSEEELWNHPDPSKEWDTFHLGQKPHLGHAIACLMILADAISLGHVIDNRPLPGPAPALLRKWKANLAR